MSRVAYIRAWPRDPATGAAGLVAMAAGGSHLPYYLDGIHYRAGGVREPRFAAALGFDEKGWTGAALPTVSTIEFAPADPALLRAYAALYWKGAAIEVDAGEEYAGVGRILTGAVADASVRDNRLQITIADFGVQLARPAIQAWFAGTGGIEGDSVCEGRVKRRNYGRCANVEGRVLLAAQNIYEFGDPVRPLQSIPTVRDMGREGPITVLAWQGSVAATLNALLAATPPQGGATAAPSIACVKWWTQPVGPLTADIQGENAGGYVETPAQIAARLLSVAGGPAIVNLADAIALRNMVAGLHIGDDSETTAAALDRLLLPVSLLWRFGTTGLIDIRPWSWDGDAEAMQGRFIGRIKTLPPTRTRRLGYDRNHRQHSDGEIAADILAAGVSYADGTTLEQLKPAEAGSNKTETRTSAAFAGQGALATRSDVIYGSHITSLPAAISPSNLISGQYLSAGFGRYLDGTTLQALRPGETGANVTESRVAASIAGQGTLATISSLGFGSPLLTGFGSLAGLGSLFFGSPYLLEGAGGAQATLSAFKTALGIASGFSGQGALATQSSLGLGSSFLTGFGSLAGMGNLFFGSPYLLESSGGAQATLSSFKTSLGTASAVLGQGPWATLGLATSLLTAENPNLVYDGGLRLGGSNWQRGAGWTISPGNNGEGAYFSKSTDGGSVSFGPYFNWSPNLSGYAQAEMFAGGMTAGDFRFDVEFFNGATLLQRSAQVGPSNGQGWTEVGTPILSPADTNRARFRFFHSAGTTNSNSALRRVKVSTASARTKFSDEATYGARYDDGQVMELLKPGEIGANVTEIRTASAIVGQGAFATKSSAAYGSALLTGFGALAPLGAISFGSGYLLESGGGPQATLGNFKTSSGVAAGIAGQGAFATVSSAAYGSPLLAGFGALSPLSAVSFGSAYLLESSGGARATLGNFKTNEGTAAAILGQSEWATSAIATTYLTNEAPNLVYDGGLSLKGERWGIGAAWSVTAGGYGEGNYFFTASNTPGVSYSDFFNLAASAVGYAQAEMFASGLVAGNFRFDVEYFNGSTFLSRSSQDGPGPGSGWTLIGIPLAAHTNCNRARVRFFVGAGSTVNAAGVAIRRIKVSAATSKSKFTDEATYGSMYADGTPMQARQPAEAGSNVTETRTAAAIIGQGSFATISAAAYGSPLLTGFGVLSSLSAVSFGSAYLLESAGGSQATLANFKTSSGTAAGIVGQSPWATSSIPTGYLTENNSNLVYDGGLTLRGQGWATAAWGWFPGANGEGAYFAANTGGTIVAVSPLFQLSSNLSGYIQGELFAGGITAGSIRIDLEFFNGSTSIGYSASYSPANGAGWTPVGGPFSSPAGTTQARARVYLQGATNTNAAFRKVKASSASGRTQFSDEATYGAMYDDGTAMRDRQPAEAGSNVTETRTASGFSGQGALATRSNIGWTDALFTGRPAWTNGTMGGALTGKLDSAQIGYGGDASLLSSRWPQEGGSNKTETRTAAAFSGQGALATRNTADMADGSITNRFAEYLVYGYNGIAMSDLRPEEAGGNQTETRTSAAINGQGAFATKSFVAASEFNSFVQYGSIRYDYSITRSDGTTTVTEAMAITQLGISAGFSGQGVLATRDDVNTGQIQDRSVTQRYFTQQPININLPNLTEVEILRVTINKQEAGSDLDILGNIRLQSSDDIRGNFTLYVDNSPVDVAPLYMNGAGGTFRTIIPYSFFLTGQSAGVFAVSIRFTRNGGASSVISAAGSNLRVNEMRK